MKHPQKHVVYTQEDIKDETSSHAYEARLYNETLEPQWISLFGENKPHTGVILPDRTNAKQQKQHWDMMYLQIFSGECNNFKRYRIMINGKETFISRYFSPFQYQSNVLQIYGGIDPTDIKILLPAVTTLKIDAYKNETEPYFPIDIGPQFCVTIKNDTNNEMLVADLLDVMGNSNNKNIQYDFADNVKSNAYNILRVEALHGSNAQCTATLSDKGSVVCPKKHPYQQQNDMLICEGPEHLFYSESLSVSVLPGSTVRYMFYKKDY